MSTTTDRIKKILQSWFITEPVLSEVFHSHKITENPHVAGIRSGKRRIEVNPDFINRLNDKTVEMYLKFETVRILLKHPYERVLSIKNVNYLASNVTVQEHLKTELPYPYASDIFPGKFHAERRTLEWYYEMLIKYLPDHKTYSDYMDTDDLLCHPAGLWGDDQLMCSEINAIIKKNEFSGNSWGSIPGQLKEIIIASAYPQIDYKAILKQFMASVISSWVITNRMRPSRRYGLGFPGFRREFVTKLAIFIDVSGSMSSDDIGRGLGLIRGFLIYGVKEIDYYTFDTSIRSKVNSKQIKAKTGGFEITGRGGTDFQCIFDLVNSNTEKYDGVIVFTDGIAFSPDIRRESVQKKTLWIFNTAHSHKRAEKHLAGCGRFTHLPDRI